MGLAEKQPARRAQRAAGGARWAQGSPNPVPSLPSKHKSHAAPPKLKGPSLFGSRATPRGRHPAGPRPPATGLPRRLRVLGTGEAPRLQPPARVEPALFYFLFIYLNYPCKLYSSATPLLASHTPPAPRSREPSRVAKGGSEQTGGSRAGSGGKEA